MSIKINLNQEGIGLVEVIISLGVAVIIVTSMVSLAVFTLNTSNRSQFLMEATRLSNQQLERLRIVRDNYPNWDDFYDDVVNGGCSQNCVSGSACYVDQGFNFRQGSAPEDDGIRFCLYGRPVDEGPNDNDDVLEVVSVSTWVIGGDRKFTHNYTRLSSWRE